MSAENTTGLWEDPFEDLLRYAEGFQRNLRIERQLHHGGVQRNRRDPRGLDRWSRVHEREVPGIKTLPYWPGIFKSQRIDRPVRRSSKILPFFLPETSFLKAQEKIYARMV